MGDPIQRAPKETDELTPLDDLAAKRLPVPSPMPDVVRAVIGLGSSDPLLTPTGSGWSAPSLPPDVDLVHESTLPVMGIPVRLRSNDPELIRSFEEGLGVWRGLIAHPELLSSAQVEGRLVLTVGEEGPVPPPVAYGFPGRGRLVITTLGSQGLSDPTRRTFDGTVTRALLATEDHFRHRFLQALLMSVVTRLDRHPVHGSAVMRDGAALLFVGPSGTGKSTLAYAAARAGVAVLSEDTVFVQLAPRLRVWGVPGPIYLPPNASRHFPELGDAVPRLLPTGKIKFVVRPLGYDAEPMLPMVEQVRVCVVARESGVPPSIEQLDAEAVERELMRPAEPGFDLFSEAERTVVARALAAPGGWRLTVGDDPPEAVPLIREMLDRIQ